jgi:serine-type D-Ala-D-Ala carboxypeptidase (penicillin-binding protein 5/6)
MFKAIKKVGIVLIVLIIALAINAARDDKIETVKSPINQTRDENIKTVKLPINQKREIDLSNLYSPHAILIDLDSGEVIGEHHQDEKIYPASLTKIMTAIVALENTSDLNKEIVVHKKMFQQLYDENASRAGFLPDEKAKARDLLYGILLPSGAECCMAFADEISGSEAQFVELMNEKAKELKLKNTHFCNVTGLQDENHYTTVQDIAKILNYALKNKEFYDAFTSKKYGASSTQLHPDGFTFNSTLFKNLSDVYVTEGEILGGKTGYTEEAGLCLASLAVVNGKDYILVTVGAKGTHATPQYHILDAKDVYSCIASN